MCEGEFYGDMGLCEVYGDIECVGVADCQHAECIFLECDGEDCEYYNKYGCNHPNCCKKERI